MKKILLTIVVLFVTTSTNLFSAENSCSQYKKWNLPTGKYNECIKNLKKEGKYEPSGVIPNIGKKISAGNHTFQIQKDGYAPISYDINVNPSKSISLDFFMNPVYDIRFKTDEKGLIFELNDKHRWTEDMISMKLEAGDHHLRVYKLGEVIDEQIIVADQPLTFQYYLKKGTVAKSGI